MERKITENEIAARKAVLEKAKGNGRTLNEYFKDAGVPKGSVYRAIKGERKLSVDTINKLTSPDANPQNGIGRADYYIAFGLEDGSIINTEIEFKKRNEDMLKRLSIYANAFSGIFKTSADENESINAALKYIEEVCKKRRSKCEVVPKREATVSSFEADLKVKINGDKHINLWQVKSLVEEESIVDKNKEILIEMDGPKEGINRYSRMMLAEIMYQKYMGGRKTSFVVSDLDRFEYYKELASKINFREPLSVLYYDRNEKKITKEANLVTTRIKD